MSPAQFFQAAARLLSGTPRPSSDPQEEASNVRPTAPFGGSDSRPSSLVPPSPLVHSPSNSSPVLANSQVAPAPVEQGSLIAGPVAVADSVDVPQAVVPQAAVPQAVVDSTPTPLLPRSVFGLSRAPGSALPGPSPHLSDASLAAVSSTTSESCPPPLISRFAESPSSGIPASVRARAAAIDALSTGFTAPSSRSGLDPAASHADEIPLAPLALSPPPLVSR